MNFDYISDPIVRAIAETSYMAGRLDEAMSMGAPRERMEKLRENIIGMTRCGNSIMEDVKNTLRRAYKIVEAAHFGEISEDDAGEIADIKETLETYLSEEKP